MTEMVNAAHGQSAIYKGASSGDDQSQPQAPQAPQACNYCSCTVGVRLIPNPYEMRVKGIEIFEYLCWNCESKLNLQAKREGW